jgi:DNA-binding transcriptional LysR family regulator
MDNLLRYQLGALRAVETVGRLGSLARAAAALGVTVGAVSQQVHNAEQQLGRPIFVRTPKGLIPTPSGERLLAGLTSGFREISRAVAIAEARADHVLTVTVAPVFAAKWLVPRLKRFHDARPDLQIRIDASVGLVDFASSDVDCGVRVGAGPWPDVRAEHLVDQCLFPACSPALAPQVREIEDLGRVPVIRDHGSSSIWDIWLAAYDRLGLALGAGPIFSDASLCLDAAIAGQGVMMAWPTLAQDAIRDGRLVSPFPKPIPTGLAYWLVMSSRRPASAKVKAFGAWIRAELTGSADI